VPANHLTLLFFGATTSLPPNSKGVKMAVQKRQKGIKTTLIISAQAHKKIKKHCEDSGISMAFFMRSAIYQKIIKEGNRK
jgi:hypothetical protein